MRIEEGEVDLGDELQRGLLLRPYHSGGEGSAGGGSGKKAAAFHGGRLQSVRGAVITPRQFVIQAINQAVARWTLQNDGMPCSTPVMFLR